jgi:hypothetical protein
MGEEAFLAFFREETGEDLPEEILEYLQSNGP